MNSHSYVLNNNKKGDRLENCTKLPKGTDDSMNKLGPITFGVQVTWKIRQIFEDYWKDLMKLQSKFFWFLKTVKI